jgi:hypothetical protein
MASRNVTPWPHGLVDGAACPSSFSIRNLFTASAFAACASARCSASWAFHQFQVIPVTPRIRLAARVACKGLRRHHRQVRATGPRGRAVIGRPSRNRPRSSAIRLAVSYRLPGSLERALVTIVARSTGTAALNRRIGSGSSSMIRRKISWRSTPRTAVCSVNNSYSVAPSA